MVSWGTESSRAPSYFSRFFENQLQQNKDGNESVRTLFIDRDPATFQDICRHLQGSTTPWTYRADTANTWLQATMSNLWMAVILSDFSPMLNSMPVRFAISLHDEFSC